MKKLMLILLAILSFDAHATDEFTRTEVKLETAWQMINIIDYGQTLDISENCNLYTELNPILGTCPEEHEVHKYFISSAIIHYLITKNITNKKYRRYWHNITIGFSLGVVSNNASIGLKINF